jgi:2-iminobutanoate/2-iminopropanoate deaminase
MLERINTENAPKAIGPYSQAIKAGGFIFVSGQIPINPKSGEVEGNTIAEQATQSLENVKAILKEAGLEMSHIVKTTCLLADIKDFAGFNEVYVKYFGAPAPARSAFAVKDLPKGVLCEIEAIAVAK